MPKALVNGIKLHYWQVGEGPDLIMIHGLTGNLALWHFTTIPALRNQYRITTYDLRGHGRSDMPPTGYTTRDMAEDLYLLMNELGIERAHLLGHSLGADVALHFALLHPDRVNRIVAVEAGLAALVHVRKDVAWPGWSEWAKGIERYGGVKVPEEKWTDIEYMLRESYKVPIVFGPNRGMPRKDDRVLQLLNNTTVVRDYEDTAGLTLDALATLPHPVLLIYGGNSTYRDSLDVLQTALPNATYAIVEDSEHFTIVEHPDGLLRYTQPFLQPDSAGDAHKVASV